ncbi:MAG: T9SS type A sorting domain-containing protein [Bacteroidetes bacterium]|nr:T9SS type A sorting domain-containing protein [Bacteroidota bacterium]
MKYWFLLYTFCITMLSAGAVKARGLPASTVRQVFALQAGDSLEYHLTSEVMGPGCGMLCNIYLLNVIDAVQYNTTNDTETVIFHSQILQSDTLPNASSCGGCRPGFWVPDYVPLDAQRWIITDLDSSISYLMDSVYGIICTRSDSSYTVSAQYNGSKQNQCGFSTCSMIDWQEIYADSIGLVYKTEWPGIAPDKTEQLTYYHKANGATWGQRYVYTGLEEVRRSAMSIYPNPATGHMTIQADSYQDMTYELYDILGQKVATGLLQATETNVDVKPLTPGMYLCHLLYTGQSVRNLKLIID